MTLGPSENERGREHAMASTGRGGAGNAVRSPSRGRPEVSQEEAKKAADFHAHQKAVHSGRGGAGNVRSPSRDPKDRAKNENLEKREHQLQAEAIKRDQHATHSSGRGGFGNMAAQTDDASSRGREGGIGGAIRSLSRSRSRDARSSSGQRTQQTDANGDKLASVDESSTLNGGDKQHGGFISKIAAHLPHGHSHNNA